MAKEGSVTNWLKGLLAGDEHDAQKLWEEYFQRLVILVKHQLAGTPRSLDDPEDIALNAFNSLCNGARHGRFPKLNDRNDLWQILLMLAERKAIDAFRRNHHEYIRKLAPLRDSLAGPEPTPSFIASLHEQFQALLDQLKPFEVPKGNDELREIATMKFEGYTNKDIAGRRGRSVATVERKLKKIRGIWTKNASND